MNRGWPGDPGKQVWTMAWRMVVQEFQSGPWGVAYKEGTGRVITRASVLLRTQNWGEGLLGKGI